MNRSSRTSLIGLRAAMLVAMAAIAVLLAACGNKGPLYMPQKPVPIDQPATSPSSTDADAKPAPAELREARDATIDPIDQPDDEND